MSYFLSEVYALDSNVGVAGLFRDMLEKAKPGALFLYCDNGCHDLYNYFESLFDQFFCELVISQLNVKLAPRCSGDKKNLGDRLDKFGQYSGLGSQVSYRVIRKL
jgi:hypothetical protein